jgi:hypothetical protein
MQIKKKIFLLACLILTAVTAAIAADISGKWTSSIETMVGTMNWSFSLKVVGEQITGTASYDGRDVPIAEGKTQGDAISFVEDRELEGLGPIGFFTKGRSFRRIKSIFTGAWEHWQRKTSSRNGPSSNTERTIRSCFFSIPLKRPDPYRETHYFFGKVRLNSSATSTSLWRMASSP